LSATLPDLTAEGTIIGTFQYMTPEQLEGKSTDARTDILAFGTGPFAGPAHRQILRHAVRLRPSIWRIQPVSGFQPVRIWAPKTEVKP
jgi:serine/threonine protein kinase